MTSMLMQHGVVENASTLVEAFDRDGFVLLESLLDTRQLKAAQTGVEWAMNHAGGAYRWIKQFTYEWPEHPIFAELMEHPLVIDFARALLSEDFHLIAAQCSRNTREPYFGGLTTIHQDAVFFPRQERQTPGVPLERYSFSGMYYLQDTPLEMGPTELLPGLHKGKQQFTNDDVTPGMVWRRAIPAGSLLLFNHRTWHRGALNMTDLPRDLITNAYARPEIEKSQLVKKQGEGPERFIEPTELLAGASPVMRQLLRAR